MTGCFGGVERVRKLILILNSKLLRHVGMYMPKQSILMIVERVIFIINLENLETWNDIF